MKRFASAACRDWRCAPIRQEQPASSEAGGALPSTTPLPATAAPAWDGAPPTAPALSAPRLGPAAALLPANPPLPPGVPLVPALLALPALPAPPTPPPGGNAPVPTENILVGPGAEIS